jgi:hypothetical protein
MRWDRLDEGDVEPESLLAPGTDAPNLDVDPSTGHEDEEVTFEAKYPADVGFGGLSDPVTGEEGHEPPGGDRDDGDLFGEAEELPSRDQVVRWARDLLAAERDSAADDGDAPEALAAEAREAVRKYATAEAVEFLRSVDRTAVFRRAPAITDADVEVVVKALREAVQKVGPDVVLAVVAQLAGDRETLRTLLLMTDASKAPTGVKELVKRFSSRGLLFAGAALVCAAGVKIGLLGDPSAE